MKVNLNAVDALGMNSVSRFPYMISMISPRSTDLFWVHGIITWSSLALPSFFFNYALRFLVSSCTHWAVALATIWKARRGVSKA